MATFKNSPASGANSSQAAGSTPTNGGTAHVDALGLIGKCAASNVNTRPGAVEYPTAKETNA